MTSPAQPGAPRPADPIPAGHPARASARSALLAALAGGVMFTVFAYVTTQMRSVRSGSPWQDDPYDTVVTFTMFFVPFLVLLMTLRLPLCRRGEPLPA